MITIQDTVKELLERTGAAVFWFYPAGWTQLPCIAWRESRNRELAQADGREYLAELEYTVDVWAKGPEEAARLAADVDALLTSVRLRRDFMESLSETGLHRRSMRYRCAADAEGRIYQ